MTFTPELYRIALLGFQHDNGLRSLALSRGHSSTVLQELVEANHAPLVEALTREGCEFDYDVSANFTRSALLVFFDNEETLSRITNLLDGNCRIQNFDAYEKKRRDVERKARIVQFGDALKYELEGVESRLNKFMEEYGDEYVALKSEGLTNGPLT